MSVDHYENFPVASVLAPAHMRPAIEAVYGFARTADDIADEGNVSDQERLDGLNALSLALDSLYAGQTTQTPLPSCVTRLTGHMQTQAQPTATFPMPLFKDLLSAFAQDVVKKRYADFADLQDYCRRSANPVGRLMLHLYGKAQEPHLQCSDDICTSLQLINFWQDVAVDWDKQRVYLPQDSLKRFGVTEDQIARKQCDDKFKALMDYELSRARDMMLRGAPLARALPGRVGWELRLVVQGGLRIIDKIYALDCNVLATRPALKPWDWVVMIKRAVFNMPR